MNSEEFLHLVAATRPVVVSECRQALRDRPACPVVELRDLVQEVHVKMWQGRERLARAQNQHGWVRRVAQQTARKCLRRLGR